MPLQVEVSDGDKGQFSGFVSVMTNARPFLCTNHGQAAMPPASLAKQLYFQAAKTPTEVALAIVKAKTGFPTTKLASRDDASLYVAAIQARPGCNLHGQHTESCIESLNSASEPFRDSDGPEGIMRGMCKMFHVQHERNRKEAIDDFQRGAGNSLVPIAVQKELMQLAEKCQPYMTPGNVELLSQDAGTYTVGNIFRPTAHPYIVHLDGHLNLETRDWATVCCPTAACNEKPCVHMASAATHADISLARLVDITDTVKAAFETYADAPTFRMARGGMEAYSDRPRSNMIELVENDGKEVELCMPPFISNPRGRPTKKRKDRMAMPFPKARRCGVCNQMTRDHDARNCKGAAEMPDSLVSLMKQPRDVSVLVPPEHAGSQRKKFAKKPVASAAANGAEGNDANDEDDAPKPCEIDPAGGPVDVMAPVVLTGLNITVFDEVGFNHGNFVIGPNADGETWDLNGNNCGGAGLAYKEVYAYAVRPAYILHLCCLVFLTLAHAVQLRKYGDDAGVRQAARSIEAAARDREGGKRKRGGTTKEDAESSPTRRSDRSTRSKMAMIADKPTKIVLLRARQPATGDEMEYLVQSTAGQSWLLEGVLKNAGYARQLGAFNRAQVQPLSA
jgi:hypothetical protein